MNGLVHFWMVCDAVQFMKEAGNHAEREAVYSLENLYGGDTPIEQIDYYNGYIQQTAGKQAIDCDTYSDLQAHVPCVGDYAEWNGEHMTCLMHYIFAFREAKHWNIAYGYHYPWSSRATLDEDFHSNWIDFLKVDVHDPSLALVRLRPHWRESEAEWVENLDRRLPFTYYPPCSALAATYYEHFIKHHWEPMHVNVFGNRPYIFGIEKLGPVFHMIGDAVVPQHVRSTHGLCHQQWEDTVYTLRYNRLVDRNNDMVRTFLNGEPFSQEWRYGSGPMKGKYTVDNVIIGVAHHVLNLLAGRTDILISFPQLGVNGILGTTAVWWATVLRNHTVEAYRRRNGDTLMNRLYNLGVAACVHTLRRAWEDLKAERVVPGPSGKVSDGMWSGTGTVADRTSSMTGLPPTRPPEKQKFEPILRIGAGEVRPEETRPNLSEEPIRLLGSLPVGANGQAAQFSDRLRTLEQVFDVNTLDALDSNRVSQVLADVQESAEQQIRTQGGPDYLRSRASDETFTHLVSHFGLRACRPPSMEECSDEQRFDQYLARYDIQLYQARLVKMTTDIAGLNVCAQGPADEIAKARRILETRRQKVIDARA